MPLLLELTFVDTIGVYLSVYCISTCALLSNANITHSRRNLYIIISTILLFLNTFVFIQGAYTGGIMWITKRSSYPGGPSGYYSVGTAHSRVVMLSDAAQNLAITLTDGILVSMFSPPPLFLMHVA
jgi:hypothetical protein